MNKNTKTDIMGKQIQCNDVVAFPRNNDLVIGKVDAIHPAMLRVIPIGSRIHTSKTGYLVYPKAVIKIDQNEGLAWVLRTG